MYPVSVGRVHISSGLDPYANLDLEPGYLDEWVGLLQPISVATFTLLFSVPQILLYWGGHTNTFVKLLDAWNSTVANFKSDIQPSEKVVKQRHRWLVHPWKYLLRRSFILRKMMMLLTNFTGARVRTQLELFELTSYHLVETTWHSVCE